MSVLDSSSPDPDAGVSLRRNNVGLYAQGFRWCKKCGEKRREQRCPVCHLLTRGRDYNYPPSKKRLALIDSRPKTARELRRDSEPSASMEGPSTSTLETVETRSRSVEIANSSRSKEGFRKP